MEETKYAQIISCSRNQKGNVPKMYLTTTIIEGYYDTVTRYLFMDLEGDQILQLYGKVNSDGHIIHKTWHELDECFDKGFSMKFRICTTDTTTMI